MNSGAGECALWVEARDKGRSRSLEDTMEAWERWRCIWAAIVVQMRIEVLGSETFVWPWRLMVNTTSSLELTRLKLRFTPASCVLERDGCVQSEFL